MNDMKMPFIGLAIIILQIGCTLDDMDTDTDQDDDQVGSITSASTSQCSLRTPTVDNPNGGRICFWDDNGFADTFKYKTVSLADFDDIDFGDKTTSVWNRMLVAWLLYDDAGYSDTRVCVKSGASVANLGNFGFNDKVSSARKLANNTCPSGVIVFSGVN